MKPTRLLMVMLTLFVATIMQAQQITCKGNIADVSGEPIIGASVVVKGTSQGTVSDLDGNFTIQANPNTTLVVSYIGYVTQEVKASDKLKITLKEDSRTLEDVVVVGYGVQKKSFVTVSRTRPPPSLYRQGECRRPRRQGGSTCRQRTEGFGLRCYRHFLIRSAWCCLSGSYPWYRNHQQQQPSLHR